MPKVLTANAQITCPHGGLGTSTPAASPIAFANGGAVLVDGDKGKVAGCANQVPCATYPLTSLQLNAAYVSGKHVMLVTDFLLTDTGFPLKIKETHEVYDNTIPAALAAGAMPVIPPELGETDTPIVAVAPPTLPFSIATFGSTSNPAMLPFVFTLSSLFPRRWTLHQVSPTASTDITAGIPASITVLPAGGAWPTSALTVAVTITGTFAATLAVGTHQLVLTAVNHRGLAAMAQATLMVSA
jgi:hypothetical protein